MINKQDLVEFETNKYIHGTYHHKKYIDRYNMNRFLSILNNPNFKEHKDFNEITNSFPLSIELISNEIIHELEEKGFEKRLKVFVGDLTYILKEIKLVLPKFDFSSLNAYLALAKRYIFSTTEKDLDLAKGHMLNFLYKYQSIEKEIISIIVSELANLVENNYYFLLAGFWYDDDDALNNKTEDKIYQLYSILYSILLNKNITKKEIVEVFNKLMGDIHYMQLTNSLFLHCTYPHGIDYGEYENKQDYNFDVCTFMDRIKIPDRFNKFSDLLEEEKDCYYILEILNTELHEEDEIIHGDITYYNQNIYKSKGFKGAKSHSIDHDKFKNGDEVKAIIKYRTKNHFPNISFLDVRSIVENNIILLKLFGNRFIKEKEELFEPDVSKMEVGYSYHILDEDYYTISTSLRSFNSDFKWFKNTIYQDFFNNKVYSEKLDTFMKHMNYKQREKSLTQVDFLILQALNKFKKSIESTSYTDVLLNTWNAFEFLTKAFRNKKGQKLNNDEKVDKVVYFVDLMYSLIYTNKHFQWDLNDKKTLNIINKKANRLVIYAYFYRNRIVHEHLIENPFMISVTRGLNILLANLLSSLIEKIIFNPDFIVENVFLQIESDLEKNVNTINQKKKESNAT